MNAERLLAHYERIADAPDAIPQLRQFSLDLAIRGKLVPQDPNDEPASELLKRIEKETGSKPRGASTDDSWPCRLPEGWIWTRLGRLVVHSDAGWSPKTEDHPRNGDEWGILKVSAVSWDQFRPWENKQVLRGTVPRLQAQVKRGDFLISRANTAELIARAVIVEEVPINLMMSDKIVRLYLAKSCDCRFVRIVNNYANFARAHYVRHASGVSPSMKNVSRDVIMDLPFPLAPFAEQRRIVAKVEELMALCDRLESRRAGREAVRDQLAAASLARLNASDPDPTTFANHARCALDALPALSTRPDQIKQLRQTIRNLAVRGRLVPQDPRDGSASELLREISNTRKMLYSEKKIPKPKELPSIDELDLPFSPPRGWVWSMLGQLCYQVSDGPHFSPRYVSPEQGVPFLSTRNIRPNGFDLSTVKYVSRADHEEFCKRIRPEKDDIIYTKGGTTGIAKVNDLNFEFSVWVHLAVLRIEKKLLCPRFVEIALNSPHCYEQSQRYTQGTSNFDLGLTRMIKITVPLPPLAEQYRIVAKVDELMALCDQLEASLTNGDNMRHRLLNALLHEALTPAVNQDKAA